MTELENLIAKCEKNAIPDNEINTQDIPELTKQDFDQGYFPNIKIKKKSVTFRIDLDILSWLKTNEEKGYQKRMNEALRWAKNNGYQFV